MSECEKTGCHVSAEAMQPAAGVKGSVREPDHEDLIVWPDDTNCYGYELDEMSHCGDDYRRIPFGTAEYNIECARLGLDAPGVEGKSK